MLAGTGVVVVLAAFAVLRWGGALPWGSDNDEYLLVAERLRSLESPLVAGVEGTKYPLGYPVLLALIGWVRLPVVEAALVANGLAIAGTALLVALTARRLGLGDVAAFGAAGYAAANAALWGSAYWVMPDTLLTLAAAAFLYVMARDGPFGWLVVVVVIAAALKTVGVVFGVAATVGLVLRGRRTVPQALVVAGGALVVTGAMWLAVAGLPEHTTGYGRTFWLEDVYDASDGEVGVREVVARLWENAGDTFRDLGWAVASPEVPVGLAQVLGLLLVGLGVLAFRRRWPTVVPFVVMYLAVVLVWPFESARFGLPLVPLTAAGVGSLVAAVTRVTPAAVGAVVTAAAVVAFALWTGPEVRTRADLEGAELAAIHQSMDDFEEWASGNLPADDEIASLDYREISRALDRDVQPVGYTADTGELLEQIGDADWFVVVEAGFHSRRLALARLLLFERPEHFEPVYAQGRVEVYSTRP